LASSRVAKIFFGVCVGVSKLHAVNLAHRDLKPANVLLTADDTPALMDFGSIAPARVQMSSMSDAHRLLDVAERQCTPLYRAPELFSVDSHTTIDEKSDVWALGAMLYFMLFNRSPFEDAAAQGSIELAVQNGVYDLPPERPTQSLPPELLKLMTQMLIVDASFRIDLKTAIDQLVSLARVCVRLGESNHTCLLGG
jgi:serine/threonine kinase 16